MPSRVFAASSDQGGELIALHNDEGFASPVLARAEDEIELALDFRSRKHVDTSEDGDEVYVLQDETSSSHTKFTMSGQATVNAFRGYLLNNLRAHQIVDNYGNECKMFEVTNDHLAVLQAKMWTKTSSGRSPIKATIYRPSRASILISDHVANISRLLEENHIFVLTETGHGTCHCLNGPHGTGNRICRSQVVRIEPLVHWGTVTPATASQSMATFRRDGSLMHVPAYKKLVRDLVDVDAPIYCFDCLEWLWSKRAEAWDIVRQLEGDALGLHTQSSNWAHHVGNCQTSESFDPTADASSLAVNSPIYQSKSIETGMYNEICIAPYQLDGTSDYLEMTQSRLPCAANDHAHGTVWDLSDSGENEVGHDSSRSSSFTLPLRTTPMTPKRSKNFLPLIGHQPTILVPTSTVPQINNVVKEDSRTQTACITNKYGFRVKVKTPPPRTTERKFGRELDANSTVPPVQVRRSPRNHVEKVLMSEKNIPLASVRPMKPLKEVKDLTKETKKRRIAPTDPQPGKQKMARTAAPRELKPTEPKVHVNPTAGLRFPPESQPVALPSSPPKLVVHFAKRSMCTDAPDGVTTLAYEAFQNDHPAPTSKICACNKPALHKQFKKGELPQIAQCVNRDCRFRWYHYACLNQSEKGKARWGTFMCQHCRNEEEFTAQDKKNGWNMAQQLDFSRMHWTRDDVEAEMPGLGGHAPVANPYGLGLEVDLGSASKTATRSKDRLGELGSFGYTPSRPHMLVEAYTNPDAYTELRAERAGKEDDDQWQHETHAAEEDYVEDEEMLDVEMEEEL
ncbi:hypothetical protein EKO04_006593 [Ascochyta lentis]|uniref:Zinc finger PHD-type domain-containing protein n=1 Tax=Ascochyta lentis TaxID=205686 RepID=A0A8H7J2J1_9PLEO|nr:hypothetical protein EKO04_006593 [Ascochyta lentis]